MRARSRHLPELAAYLRRIGSVPLLTPEQERELGRRALAGCAASRAALVEANLRLVVMVARRFRNRGLDLADLIAEGNLGLLRAAARFDPDMGCRFSTFAVFWIQQPIRRALDRVPPVRLPAHMVARAAAWRRTRASLTDTLGRVPLDLEVATALGLRELLARGVSAAVRTAERRHLSLEAFRDGEDAPLSESLPDLAVEAPWERRDVTAEQSCVRSLLELLDARSRRILELRFGLGHERPLSLVEVGEVVQLTRERVRQIEHAALRTLQSAALSGASAGGLRPPA